MKEEAKKEEEEEKGEGEGEGAIKFKYVYLSCFGEYGLNKYIQQEMTTEEALLILLEEKDDIVKCEIPAKLGLPLVLYKTESKCELNKNNPNAKNNEMASYLTSDLDFKKNEKLA